MREKYIFPWLLFLAACASMPDFGLPIQEVPPGNAYTSWFSNLPSQYVMKQVVSLESSESRMDLMAYLLVKNECFRIVAMNELGMTLLDVYSPEKGNPVVVKASGRFAHPALVENMVRDIRMAFLSRYLLNEKGFSVYGSGESEILVSREEGLWHAWETKKGRPEKIRSGQKDVVFRTIQYSYGPDSPGFPSDMRIHYPTAGVVLTLKIVSIDAKDIPDERLKPQKP